ncbi:unnamed protein product [Fraxinus pennsylvanica]|uniref:Uncharacterized protein n=1 Tax=Fraxinus pennsylvanica TaxID=56036 RepID=A0AAD2A6L4_9LAMI|nr:unnamed protein product [Fraxinus pennsylvanica]
MQTIEKCGKDNDIAIAKLHAILEVVSDRVEMHTNMGFYQLLEESIESTLEGGELERRVNGEIYETKVALRLGRSLKQLKELAMASTSSLKNGETIQEFASKLF